ncbi:hypothetical protein GF366_02555 [Candidatus Peregrinibacteria bacterium]|nr:hypothetical protein [Candidatus Peregrinibacteria bacterium]
MFKEKFLIFKQGPAKKEGPGKPPEKLKLKEKYEVVEERHELAADIAEGLISGTAAGAVEATEEAKIAEEEAKGKKEKEKKEK